MSQNTRCCIPLSHPWPGASRRGLIRESSEMRGITANKGGGGANAYCFQGDRGGADLPVKAEGGGASQGAAFSCAPVKTATALVPWAAESTAQAGAPASSWLFLLSPAALHLPGPCTGTRNRSCHPECVHSWGHRWSSQPGRGS